MGVPLAMPDTRVTNPLVDQFKKGGIPIDLRLMAAQGALPLTPADLVELLHHLLRDADSRVKQAASTSLTTMPADALLPLAKDRGTPTEVLAWILVYREDRELRESVLQNTSLEDEALESVAGSLSEALAELVVINQVRLLRRTSLLEALEKNPSLSNDQKRRLRELRESFHIGGVAAPAPPPAAPAPPPEAGPTLGDELQEALPEEPAPQTDEEALVRYLSVEERDEAEKVSVVQRIFRLNTAEKVIAALKGNREERAILVRDPNRIVSSAVLGSPRLTEAEIESFSGMKNVSDAILRQIGTHREWTKRYAVVANLVKNPRTPVGISLTLCSRLNPRDIKSLTVDRNVPEVIRKHAQKFLPNTGGGKKH
jgi:hypothetical protein